MSAGYQMSSKTIAYDLEIESLLSEPLHAVVEREQGEFERLLASTQNRVVLYGAGSLGTRALRCLRSFGIEPLALADGDPLRWGTIIEGVAVLSPLEAAQRYGSDALFLVTIWNAKQRFAETSSSLTRMGCSTIAPPSSLQWRFAETFLPFFSSDLPRQVIRCRRDVLAASMLWADERSRREYLAHIKWRLRGDFEALLPPTAEEQYFPSFVELVPDEVFLDCGAYDGDTLRALIEHSKGVFREAVAVEPAPETLSNLETWVAELPAPVRGKIEVHGCALGSSRGTIRFSGAGRDAHVSNGGEYAVVLNTVDDLCAKRCVTYIKMDIEGAEVDALAGAQRTIVRDRPILAVCVYHAASHLWRIPLMIRDLVPDYRMFLRSHENDGWETVVYALPPERSPATE